MVTKKFEREFTILELKFARMIFRLPEAVNFFATIQTGGERVFENDYLLGVRPESAMGKGDSHLCETVFFRICAFYFQFSRYAER